MTDTPVDPISAAFEHMRAEAAKRGDVPDLRYQAAKVVKPKPKTKKWTNSAADGRRVSRMAFDVEGFGSILAEEIKQRGWKKGIAGGWIHNNWEGLVGPQIAAHTSVEMLKDKKLFITCDSTAWATNLRMMQRTILQAIAEKVGPDVVAELKIFGPKAPSWRHGPLHVKGRGPRDTYG